MPLQDLEDGKVIISLLKFVVSQSTILIECCSSEMFISNNVKPLIVTICLPSAVRIA